MLQVILALFLGSTLFLDLWYGFNFLFVTWPPSFLVARAPAQLPAAFFPSAFLNVS